MHSKQFCIAHILLGVHSSEMSYKLRTTWFVGNIYPNFLSPVPLSSAGGGPHA